KVLRSGKPVGGRETGRFGGLRHSAGWNEGMNILSELKLRFRAALEPLVTDPTEVLEMIRPAQDPRFGDYQANCAMPLGKQLGRAPREIAAQIVERLEIADLCQTPLEIAGPGFI